MAAISNNQYLSALECEGLWRGSERWCLAGWMDIDKCPWITLFQYGIWGVNVLIATKIEFQPMDYTISYKIDENKVFKSSG